MVVLDNDDDDDGNDDDGKDDDDDCNNDDDDCNNDDDDDDDDEITGVCYKYGRLVFEDVDDNYYFNIKNNNNGTVFIIDLIH